MSLRSRKIGRVVAVLAFAAIATLTLQPRPELAALSAATPVWCLVCGSYGLVDVVLNVLLFVPLGVGLGLAGVRPRAAIIIVFLTTLTVELLQLTVISGRDSSLSDLVTNTTGGAIGLALASGWRALLFPAPPRDLQLGLGWGLAAILVALGTGAMVAPSMPDPPYWGQWTPELGGLEQHRGRVASAFVEGIAVRQGRLRESATLADSVKDGEVEAVVLAMLAEPTTGLAPIFRVVDGYGNQVLLVAQHGTDLVVQTGVRAERSRLRPVTLRIARGLEGAEGRQVEVVARSDARGYVVTAEWDGGGGRLERRRSVAWGWRLLLPFDRLLGSRDRVFDALWIAGLFIPVGWWLGQGRGARRNGTAVAGIAAAVVLAGVLMIAPIAGGLGLAGLPSWAGALGGLTAGSAAGRVGRRIIAQHRASTGGE